MNKRGKFFCIITVLVGFTFFGCTSANPPVDKGAKKTAGILNVSTVTSTAGGEYSPSHIMAVWIENSSGKFVKTLLINAQTRKSYLTDWLGSTTSGNSVDAITGATLETHGTITCIWNGTDTNGALVSDGTYKVCMELTESHTHGNFSTFTFAKDSVGNSQSPANQPSFSSITVHWTPN